MTNQEFFHNWQLAFGRSPNPFEYQDMEKWIEELSVEVVNEVLRLIVYQEKVNMRYFASIIADWERKGIKSLADVENNKAQHENTKAKSKGATNSKSNVPNWSNPNYKEPEVDLLEDKVVFNLIKDITWKMYRLELNWAKYQNFVKYSQGGVMKNGVELKVNPVNIYAAFNGITSEEAEKAMFAHKKKELLAYEQNR